MKYFSYIVGLILFGLVLHHVQIFNHTNNAINFNGFDVELNEPSLIEGEKEFDPFGELWHMPIRVTEVIKHFTLQVLFYMPPHQPVLLLPPEFSISYTAFA